jgi:TorA maturation chaperone TorD
MTTKTTGDELALSRAVMYRFLSLACAYPTRDALAALRETAPAACEAAISFGRRIELAVRELSERVVSSADEAIERAHTIAFTMTASETCPTHETAYTAKHLFQVSEQMADVAGFYRAFGVDAQGERPDSLAMELEFAYLLALKEAYAIEHHGAAKVVLVRRAERAFLRDHLGRWGGVVSARMVARDPEGVIGATGELLGAFLALDQRRLRSGASAPLPEKPYRPKDDDDDEAPCMAGQLAGGSDDEG